ncbi:MAG: radical SAM family heme chaperone HemW [Eubacteriales bacterium]|nr:radical SAM family heme chaperone HemW [Eubacteriales bacterium]
MKQDLSLYIHIPFCKKKCFYCDFCSAVSTSDKKEQYIQLLLSELETYAKLHTQSTIKTIFIGGGTPSTLPPHLFNKVFSKIHQHFTIAANAEISVEVNPESATIDFLHTLKQNGVNRLSFGVQSFNDEILKKIGRAHNSKTAVQAIKNAQNMGFNNINLDLMYGLPGQTLEDYQHSLQIALSLNILHISAYNLIVEEDTVLKKQLQNNLITIPTEDLQIQMYELGKEILAQNGFHQYEISNFAKEGYECKHNLCYWQRGSYLGVGQSAHGFIKDNLPFRYYHSRRFVEYQAEIEKESYPNKQYISKEDAMFETIMLGLRLVKGFDLNIFKEEFQIDFCEYYKLALQKLQEQNLLNIQNNRVFLSDKGLKLQNQVLLEFMQ